MHEKKCSKCGEVKPIERFAIKRSVKSGRQSQCKDCKNIHGKRHYQQNKQLYLDKAKRNTAKTRQWWNEYKKTLKCARCSESHPACIEFHHLDPSKKDFEISRIKFNSREKLMKELDKCIPLCANCHRKEHYNVSIA